MSLRGFIKYIWLKRIEYDLDKCIKFKNIYICNLEREFTRVVHLSKVGKFIANIDLRKSSLSIYYSIPYITRYRLIRNWLRSLSQLILLYNNIIILHGLAVDLEDGFIWLAPSKAGKSSLAKKLEANYIDRLYGDDFILYDLSSGEVIRTYLTFRGLDIKLNLDRFSPKVLYVDKLSNIDVMEYIRWSIRSSLSYHLHGWIVFDLMGFKRLEDKALETILNKMKLLEASILLNRFK